MVSISAKHLQEDMEIVEGVEKSIATQMELGKLEADAEDVLQRLVKINKALAAFDIAMDGGRDMPVLTADIKEVMKSSLFSPAEKKKLEDAADELSMVTKELEIVTTKLSGAADAVEEVLGARFGEHVEL